jgi:hypothetical protein
MQQHNYMIFSFNPWQHGPNVAGYLKIEKYSQNNDASED